MSLLMVIAKSSSESVPAVGCGCGLIGAIVCPIIVSNKGYGGGYIIAYALLGLLCWPLGITLALLKPDLHKQSQLPMQQMKQRRMQQGNFNPQQPYSHGRGSVDPHVNTCQHCGGNNPKTFSTCQHCGQRVNPPTENGESGR